MTEEGKRDVRDMYKVVIADDERRIREGLRLLLNWEELGFEVDEIFELIGISTGQLPGGDAPL